MTDKNISDIAEGFLSGLENPDLELILQDIRYIKENNATLLLAIEAYDIINYYAPYFDKRFLEYNDETIKQKIVVNEKVFNNQPSPKDQSSPKDVIYEKVVLLKQYQTELFYFKSELDNKIRKYKTPELVDALRDEVSVIKKKSAKPDDLGVKEFEKLTLYLMLNSKGGILQDFNKFIIEKIINVFDLDGIINRSDHERILLLDPDEDRIEHIYEIFVTDTKNYREQNLSPREQFHYLENSHSDIEAISTIIDYNHHLSKSNVLLLYVSSAERTKIFSDIAGKGGYFPTIKGRENYNIIRTIPQIFFTKILLEEKDRNKDFDPVKTLEDMLAVKTIDRKRHGAGKPLQLVTNMIRNHYSLINTHFYYDTYCSYKKLLDNQAADADADTQQIVDLLDDYLKNKSISNLDLETYIKNYKTKFLLSSLLSSKERISVRFGKDIIRNSFHHLPYLLFITNTAEPEIATDTLYDFLVGITDICNFTQRVQQDITGAVMDYIKKHMNADFKKEIFLKSYIRRSLIDKYLYSFFFKSSYIFSRADISSGIDTLDVDELIRSLKKERRLLNSVEYPNTTTSESVKASLTREMDYVLLWLYRRNKRNSEAIKLGEKLIETYNDDGRLYHGLALAYIEFMYSELDKKDADYAGVLDKTDAVVEPLLSKAAYYYEQLQQRNSEVWNNSHISELIVKSRCAVHNTLADLFIRKYETLKLTGVIPSFEILKQARTHIKEAKNCLQEIGAMYEKYPINNITEAELEYFEALHYFEEGDYVNAGTRIEFASQRCHHGKSISVEKRFSDKIDDIKKLKDEIDRKRSGAAPN